jgi:hypothetical protein
VSLRSLVAMCVVLAACGGAGTPTDEPPSTSATTATTATSPPVTALPATSTSTTIPATTTTRPALPDPPPFGDGETVCDLYGSAEQIGQVRDIGLIEISGIAASRSHDGVVWAVNDSGDGPTVYAIEEGETISTVTLNGAFPIDWEDLDIGPGPDGSDHLFVGDIGDNIGFRPWVSIFRLPEPDPTASSDIAATAEELELVYPDVDSVDAEAIAVDPVTGDIFVIPKSRSAVGVYRAASGELGDRVTMERIATLDLGAEITSAAFSPSGDRLVLRGYKTIWAWPRTTLDLADVITDVPCQTDSATEGQGEAITVRPDNGLITISEGGRPPVNLVPATG